MDNLTKEQVFELRKNLPKDFCPVPFTTIILEPNGNVGICRHHGPNFPIGHISQNTIEEIWNGPNAQKWRTEFLQNKISTCDPILHERHCNLTHQWNELLPHIDLTQTTSLPILKLTANFNGQCNLRCQMCSIWKSPNGLYHKINFWEPAKKHIFPHLKEIDMLGGEPFIQSDTFQLMDDVYEVNPDCRWNITTNLHWEFDQKIRDNFERLNFRNINVSIDSLDPTLFHKIRYPGDLNLVLKNLQILKAYAQKKPFEISINFTMQKDNWFEAPDLVEYCLENGFVPHLFLLKQPTSMSTLDLNIEDRKKILDYYFSKLPNQKLAHLLRIMNPLIFSLPKIEQAHYQLNFQTALQ